MKIDIQFIPTAEMRFPDQLGDWWFVGDTLHVRATNDTPEVTEGGDRWPFLIALHELVEGFLCREHGVSQDAVDAFDIAFVPPKEDPEAEAGDDPTAPYRTEHRAAMLIEHFMASFLGVTDYGTVR